MVWFLALPHATDASRLRFIWNGVAMSSSPWGGLWKGDEDVAAPFQKREHGFIAIFMDTEGNVVGLHSLK
jgi:hypothetical protein